MNIKEKFLEMEKQFAKESSREPVENVEDLLVTFIFKFQFFEPCKYLSEDDEWVTFMLIPANEVMGSQVMTLRKSEIVSFGVLDGKSLERLDELINEIEPESLYQ